MQPKGYVLTAILILALAGVSAFYYSTYVSSYSVVKSSFVSTCKHVDGYVTIIANSSGYNDSISHGAPSTAWPIIHASQGGTVHLLLCNLDTIETHGFAIDHYFDSGVVLRPGAAYELTFTATQTGDFRIYCDVFCTVHRFMLGSLVVS